MKEYDTFKLILFVRAAFVLLSPFLSLRAHEMRWKSEEKENLRQKPIQEALKRSDDNEKCTTFTAAAVVAAMNDGRSTGINRFALKIARCMRMSHIQKYEIAFRFWFLHCHHRLRCDCLWFRIAFYFVNCEFERYFTEHSQNHRTIFWWAPFPPTNRSTAFKSNNKIEYENWEGKKAHYRIHGDRRLCLCAAKCSKLPIGWLEWPHFETEMHTF